MQDRSILVAIGVDGGGSRSILGVVAGDREDYEAWCTLLGQLKVRGLEVPRLIASNACSALLEAAAELFPNAFAAWRVTLRSDPARPVAGHGYDESAVFSR